MKSELISVFKQAFFIVQADLLRKLK